MSFIIDISASSEPECSYVQPSRKTSIGDLREKRPRTQIGPVIELTDSDSDTEDASRHSYQREIFSHNSSSCSKKPPSLTPFRPVAGGSGSLQNVSPRGKQTKIPSPKVSQIFTSSDGENESLALVHPIIDQFAVGVVNMDRGYISLQVPQQPTLPDEPFGKESQGDLISGYVASVLEIIPDVEPDHLLSLIAKFTPSLRDEVVERVLHELFEDPAYPKVDKGKGKGKRKQIDDEILAEGGSPKKFKVDYSDRNRAFQGGMHYARLALERLQIDNPYIPKSYLRQLLRSFNGLYAPTHLFLIEQEKQSGKNDAASLPYTRMKRPFCPNSKGKNRVLEDAEFTKEVEWLRDEAERQDRLVAQELKDEELGDGVECSCCFSTVPFDNMIQCPEAHLFCSQCMSSYAGTLLGSHNPNITCIHESECKVAIPASELQRFLSPKMMELWERLKQRKEVEAAGLVGLEECPFCEWSCVIENEEEKLFRCGNSEICGVVSCRGCKKVDHLPRSCKEADEDKTLDGRHSIEEAMTRALMRNCPKCQKPFIKEHGCNKMTCPNCSTLSCYVCRQIITGYDHFKQQTTGQIPTTSQQAGGCLLWDAVEKRHADEVAAAAQHALEEYKQKNPDVDEKALLVDLPSSTAPAQPVNGINMGLAMGQIHPFRNQIDGAREQALQVQLTLLQQQRDASQTLIGEFEKQKHLWRIASARAKDSQVYHQRKVEMERSSEEERGRLMNLQARIVEVQSQMDAVRANATAAAGPLPHAVIPRPPNINANRNRGRQPVTFRPLKKGRR